MPDLPPVAVQGNVESPHFLAEARLHAWTLDTPMAPSPESWTHLGDEPLATHLARLPAAFPTLVALGAEDPPARWRARFESTEHNPLRHALASANVRAVRWLKRRAMTAGCSSVWFDATLRAALNDRCDEVLSQSISSRREQHRMAVCVRAVWPASGCDIRALRRTRATSRIWPGFAHFLFEEPHGFRRLLGRVLPVDARLGRIGWAAFTLSRPLDMGWTSPHLQDSQATRLLVAELLQSSRMDGWKKAYRTWCDAIQKAGGRRLPGLAQALEAVRSGQERWEAVEAAARLDGALPVPPPRVQRRRM